MSFSHSGFVSHEEEPAEVESREKGWRREGINKGFPQL
jgi:hypothetical protein